MSKIPEFRVWYDNKMWCLAKLDLWGDPDQAICDLAPYLPKYEELYDIYLSDVILMQSTGLKDKNGVEIYEGDVLYFEPYETHINDRVVEYIDGAYRGRFIRSGHSKLLTECLYETKVIGNIYQNNDLLEEEK
jgi:uncharacterized phage protein (TIGR01671 family)